MRPSGLNPTRRAALAGLGAAALAAPLAARAAAPPSLGEKTRAALAAADLAEAKPDARLILTAPEIAENGADVQIELSFSDPSLHLKRAALLADKNLEALLGEYHFSARTGRKARLAARHRLMETGEVVAAAELSDGSKIMSAPRLVKVAIGACGGG